MKSVMKYVRYDLKTGRVLQYSTFTEPPITPEGADFAWMPVTDMEIAAVGAGDYIYVKHGFMEKIGPVAMTITGEPIQGQPITVSAGNGDSALEISLLGPGAHRAIMLAGQAQYTLTFEVAGQWTVRIEGPEPYYSKKVVLDITGTTAPPAAGTAYEAELVGGVHHVRLTAAVREAADKEHRRAELPARLAALKANRGAPPAARIDALETLLTDLIDLSR